MGFTASGFFGFLGFFFDWMTQIYLCFGQQPFLLCNTLIPFKSNIYNNIIITFTQAQISINCGMKLKHWTVSLTTLSRAGRYAGYGGNVNCHSLIIQIKRTVWDIILQSAVEKQMFSSRKHLYSFKKKKSKWNNQPKIACLSALAKNSQTDNSHTSTNSPTTLCTPLPTDTEWFINPFQKSGSHDITKYSGQTVKCQGDKIQCSKNNNDRGVALRHRQVQHLETSLLLTRKL